MIHSAAASQTLSRADELLRDHQQSIYRRTDHLFAVLMLCQWLAGIGVALAISPLTWSGRMSSIHPHMTAALGLGSLITAFPVVLAWTRPGWTGTRHVIAVGQMLWSALLIHLTGGRIETHFHVFGSLAFLAFYRDWRVLISGTVVVAADHFLRGLFWPESVYGVIVRSEWRWLEHAWWVIFEDFILIQACLRGVREMREIADRQAETEISSERRYETLLNSVEGIVWEARADTMEFTLVSRQAEELLGYPVSHWLGTGEFWKGLIHPEDRARVVASFRDNVARSAHFEEEYRLQSATGAIYWVRDVVTVIAEPGKPVLLRGVMTDLTERKRVETMKSEFISTVSHELRTPLTSIRGSLGLIAGGVTGPLPPKAKGMLEIAAKNCERLVTLVNDILDISKVESGKMNYHLRTLDLGTLVGKAVDANRAYAQSFGVTIDWSVPPSAPLIVADEDRMIQIVTNLLSNACKFSPRGQSVQVRVEPSGSDAIVSVEDHGRGIPEEFKNRIFEKFAQADGSDRRQRQGSGLGLSICKAITEQMGGRITFTSQEGAGSIFRLHFPVKAGETTTAPERTPSRPALLICEDDQDIALILRATLDCAGFDSDIAGCAREARALLARRRYAGMTLDLGLPDENGLSLLKSIRENPETRSLPVIVVSAYIDEARQAVAGDAFGIIDWIEKPINENRLQTALQKAVQTRNGERARILHVEDDPEIHEILKATLAGLADVRVAASLEAARAEVRKGRFDVLILDLGLPDGSGLELIPSLRGSANALTPVVIFSACQVSQMVARSVACTLLKSKTSNEEMVAKIRSILGNPAPEGSLQPVTAGV